MQPDGQLCDLTDPLLLLRNRGPHKLLELSVQDGHGLGAATLSGELSNPSDRPTGHLAPKLILDKTQTAHIIAFNIWEYG